MSNRAKSSEGAESVAKYETTRNHRAGKSDPSAKADRARALGGVGRGRRNTDERSAKKPSRGGGGRGVAGGDQAGACTIAKKTGHPIGHGQTAFGFDLHGLISVHHACSSRPGDRRRWSAIRVYCVNGDYIDIEATPRLSSVKVVKNKIERGKPERFMDDHDGGGWIG